MSSVSPPVRVFLQLAGGIDAGQCPSENDFNRWVAAAAEAGARSLPDAVSVTVRLTNADEIAGLNEAFRGKPGATNVLAFPGSLEPLMVEELEDELELGDIVICVEQAAAEAAEQGKSLSQHLTHLTVHATLHLLGYDHDQEAEAEEMEALERRILESLGLPDPYLAG